MSSSMTDASIRGVPARSAARPSFTACACRPATWHARMAATKVRLSRGTSSFDILATMARAACHRAVREKAVMSVLYSPVSASSPLSRISSKASRATSHFPARPAQLMYAAYVMASLRTFISRSSLRQRASSELRSNADSRALYVTTSGSTWSSCIARNAFSARVQCSFAQALMSVLCAVTSARMLLIRISRKTALAALAAPSGMIEQTLIRVL
mmetsp:Transcript_36666/g.70673  ORF Transcript_36666/g.70673 Transcript_36666/m.70673 type:complete len:214 (+) Transcript_36666:575-1216(+)